MMNEKDKLELSKLILELMEGSISSQQMEILDRLLYQSPESLDFYRDFIKNTVVLKKINVFQGRNEELTKPDLWQALARQEKMAPAVQIPQEKPIEEPIQKIDRQGIQIRINRGSLVTLLLSIAAILLLVAVIRFVPKKSGIEVATLTDSLNAKWADADTLMGKGTRLVTGSTDYLLREGIARIEFDNQARMTIEAPAEFEILTGDQVKLNYGRLYAAIPQSAIGFTVGTQSARIIDLGTEFGIDAGTSGDTFLHVIKGKTTLIAGEKSNKISMEVIEGAAKKVSSLTKTISDIHIEETLFVRNIDSKNNVVWRGEMLPGTGIYIGQSNLTDTPYHQDDGKQITIYSDGDVWNQADRCYYYYVPLHGSGQLSCRVVNLTNQWINPDVQHEQTENFWTKAGIMVRQSLAPQSAQFDINITPMLNPDGSAGLRQFQLQYRPSAGAATVEVVNRDSTVVVGKNTWLKIIRRGSTLTGYRSLNDGMTWTKFGSTEVSWTPDVYIGLFLAGAPAMSANVVIDNVMFSNTVD